MTVLTEPPAVYSVESEAFPSDGEIRPIFYEGLPYQGQPTRVFAWVGIPVERAGPVPGIVLVHGGGGTAFRDWAQLWVDRGYAVIAMDTSGGIPLRDEVNEKRWQRHEFSGPQGWGGFRLVDEPVEDQWVYHAVADVILGASLLASLSEVDPERIGIMGVSWGGFLTNIVVGLDSRFCFAVPVYGCGFIGENSSWSERALKSVGSEKAERWLALWDPGHYVGSTEVPMLFSNGTNDKHYRMDAWQKTYCEVTAPRTLSLKVRMPHSVKSADTPEVVVFADSMVGQGAPLPKFVEEGQDGGELWAVYESPVVVVRAELVFTRDPGQGPDRHWETLPASFDPEKGEVSAVMPDGAASCYLNIIDERDCVVSTEHIDIGV